ncbi:hypothetical protein [Pseudaquabacterium rugosum]|uniref:Uncharacterized protein n=1 Tax=Pseudaquabacterium rugosum TaxID=2984194 RepID=A0ABU9B451_9BURK
MTFFSSLVIGAAVARAPFCASVAMPLSPVPTRDVDVRQEDITQKRLFAGALTDF